MTAFDEWQANSHRALHLQLIMSQVFAAVTHKLSEEYGKIELPNQEAKTRYAAAPGSTALRLKG